MFPCSHCFSKTTPPHTHKLSYLFLFRGRGIWNITKLTLFCRWQNTSTFCCCCLLCTNEAKHPALSLPTKDSSLACKRSINKSSSLYLPPHHEIVNNFLRKFGRGRMCISRRRCIHTGINNNIKIQSIWTGLQSDIPCCCNHRF